MAIKIGSEKIDLYDNSNVKVLDEKATRAKLLARAKSLGIERDLLILLDKYDTLMRNCTNEGERRDMGKLGAFEVYNLFNRGGELYVDGQLIHKSQ